MNNKSLNISQNPDDQDHKPQESEQSQYQMLRRKQKSYQSPLRNQQIEASCGSEQSFDYRINLTLSMISASTNKAQELSKAIKNIIISAKAIDKEMLDLHNLQKDAIMQLVEAELQQ